MSNEKPASQQVSHQNESEAGSAAGNPQVLRLNQVRWGTGAVVLAYPHGLVALGARHVGLMPVSRQALQPGSLDVAASVRTALSQPLPFDPETLTSGVDLAPQDVLLAADPHDAFFRVARTSAPVAQAWQFGVQQALAVWLAECGDAFDDADAQAVGAVLLALADPAAAGRGVEGGPGAAASDITRDDVARARPDAAEAAVLRWLRGHQMFAVLTQGIVLQVQAISRAARGPDPAQLQASLHGLAYLYDCSAASLRMTGNFERHHYADTIRPSMSEPHAPAGFSGTLATDHTVMVRQLVAATDAFAVGARLCPAAHAEVKAALSELYTSHRCVCERLANAALPSIRSASLTEAQHPAGELLDRFRDRRIELLR